MSAHMTRGVSILVIGFALGCVAALAVPGCSKPADRTLTIYQFQSTDTYDGQFQIDTSDLPADAIETTVDTGGPGNSARRINLNMKYEFEIVVKLVGSPAIDSRDDSDSQVK